MALKTIFKGTINGKEFDNVKDYNAEMTRLINASKTVDAKSETRMVEVCDTCNCEECNCDKQLTEERVNMLPFCDSPAYLDKLVSTCSNTNDQNLADMEEFLNNHIGKIVKRMDKFDTNQLNNYAKDIKKVLNQLQIDGNKTSECLDKIEKKIDELESKHECLEASQDAIDILLDFYEDLLSKVTYKIENGFQFKIENVKYPNVEYRGCNGCDKCQDGPRSSGQEDSCAPGNEELRKHYKSDMADFWDQLLKILP